MISFELICSYHSLAPMYYRGAKGAIVIYDITSRVSFITVVHCQVTFARAKDWVTELKQNCKNIGLNLSVANNPELVIALAGNKCDLVENVDYLRSLIDKQREVPKELAEEYAKEANNKYLNKVVKVLIEGPSDKGGKMMGYTDTMKLVNVDCDPKYLGEIVDVVITDIKTWSMEGVIKK